jgi:hypothetical protein
VKLVRSNLGVGERIATLVGSLAVLAERVPIFEFAVIGGLAVLVHLEGAHRATDDVDTVAAQHRDAPTAIDVLKAQLGASGTVLGIKVDCIAVGETPASAFSPSELPVDELDRIFVLAHRWAFDTAHELALVASAAGESTSRARCRFASPASIIAMKLQSAPRRKAECAHKAGGDYFDILRLVSKPTLTVAIADALRRAPHDLGVWSVAQIRRRLMNESGRTAAVIARSGVAGRDVPSADDLTRAGQRLLALFERAK